MGDKNPKKQPKPKKNVKKGGAPVKEAAVETTAKAKSK